MEVSEFNSETANLLDTLSPENKTVVLLRDFSADLLKYDQNSNITDFLDLMYSSFLLPPIFSPTRTTTISTILAVKTFTNN